jgi:hypothetical protein
MQIFPTLRNAAIILLSLTITVLTSCHQTPDKPAGDSATAPTKVYLPHMYVDDAIGTRDEKNFFPFAKMLSTSTFSETDSIYFPIQGFTEMITTISGLHRIEYLDIYPVVRRSTGKLDLLFAGVDSDCNDIAYFHLNEDATTWPQNGDYVSASDASDWQDLYYTSVVRQLNQTLDETDPVNHIGRLRKTPLYNTLHLSHFITDFKELLDEVTYQSKLPSPRNRNFDGIKAYFAAKPSVPKGNREAYGNRLYILFEYTIGRKVYPIDKDGRTAPAANLPDPTKCPASFFFQKDTSYKIVNGILSNNNGQMCPPACNP